MKWPADSASPKALTAPAALSVNKDTVDAFRFENLAAANRRCATASPPLAWVEGQQANDVREAARLALAALQMDDATDAGEIARTAR